MLILITGDREWRDRESIERAFDAFRFIEDVTVIHGAARGADSIAGEIARSYGWTVKEYPADWNEHGKAAGPIRNREMLREKLNVVLAFHDDLSKSKGTKDMIQAANRANIPVRLYASARRPAPSRETP